MAQSVIVQLVDDLDGTTTDDISTVTFGLDGAAYEIDLTVDNADRLRDGLADFVAAARRTGGRIKRTATATSVARPVATDASTRPVTDRAHTKAVREWARQNGFNLADRGRIPGDVLEAFETAHATNGRTKKAKKPELAFSS